MAQIVRPVRGPLRVSLAFRSYGGNYELLRTICGEKTKAAYNKRGKYYEVARAHLAKLIDQLPNLTGGPVKVVLHGAAQTKCVAACWAADPATVWECVCSCAGTNHGKGSALPKLVSADLSVATEYTSNTYVIRPKR